MNRPAKLSDDGLVLTEDQEPRVRTDVARNRARILQAARSAFSEHGAGVPISTIARAAGVGTATLYRHFPSRDELLTAMFDGEIRTRITVLDRAVADPDPWHGFVQSLNTVAEMDIAYPGLGDAIVSRRDSIPIYDDLWEHAMSGLSALAARLRAAGTVRQDFGPADIVVILTALNGITRGGQENSQRQAQRLILHLTRGILVQPEA
jgi:AcrR family transcriptional regulator